MRCFEKAAILGVGVWMAAHAAMGSPGKEEEKVLQADREWAAAASEGKDVDRIVSFWSDDATVYPPGSPVISGKAAIREFVTRSLATPGFHITWQSDRAVVSADGTMAYTTGTNTMTVPGADGKLMTISGRSISVWKRGPGGAWKSVVDIWNSGP